MVSSAAQASHAAAIRRDGVPIVYVRNIGFEPNVVSVTASLNAVIRMMRPDTEGPAQAGIASSTPGAIGEDQRFVLLMASDLTAGGISLPAIRGDRIRVPATGEVMNVDRVDPYKRAFAGAIEIFASAVA